MLLNLSNEETNLLQLQKSGEDAQMGTGDLQQIPKNDTKGKMTILKGMISFSFHEQIVQKNKLCDNIVSKLVLPSSYSKCKTNFLSKGQFLSWDWYFK